jgi:hypothetical protein
MRIATVTVGTSATMFRNIEANEARLGLADEIAKCCRNVDLVVLPAGFLAVSTSTTAAVRKTAEKLAALFPKNGLIAGIDLAAGKGSRGGKGGKSSGAATIQNYWAFAAYRGDVVGGPWRQRTATSSDQTDDNTARLATFGRTEVGVLICGEMFNPALTPKLREAEPDLVVDIGHLSMTRFGKSLSRVARDIGAETFFCQHVSTVSQNPKSWRVTSRGRVNPSQGAVGVVFNDMWASVNTWTV